MNNAASALGPICVVRAQFPAHTPIVRELFAEYAGGLPCGACKSLVHQGFNEELASLPGDYALPKGCVLLAYAGAVPIGCVALRPLHPSGVLPGDPTPICEMKRMYIRPTARGLRAGHALCSALLANARESGYRMMKLDTEPDFHAAIATYRKAGFVEIPRYNDDPVDFTTYFGIRL